MKRRRHASEAPAGAEHKILDLDRPLRTPGSFNPPLTLLIVIGLVVVPSLSLAAKALGIDSWTIQVVLSLLFAAVIVPTHWRLAFDDRRVPRRAHAAQDTLRRYDPDSGVRRHGRHPASGEYDISVLFADVRGFTSFSERRAAAEIFSTVSEYVKTVSEIVSCHGGTVVEFSGDGIMAVFGVPHVLSEKERAAVAAGRAIVAAMGSAGPVGNFQGVPLTVGIGIATGTDFVGHIRTTDHGIWTAIGNTTNRAARLQSLTRKLDAAIAVDAATQAALGHAAEGFERYRNVPIRGLHDGEDVYALPLPARIVAFGPLDEIRLEGRSAAWRAYR